MDHETPASSTLRFRHSAARPCAVADADNDPPKHESTKAIIRKDRDISRVDSSRTKNKNIKRKRGRIRTEKKRTEEKEESMVCLVATTAILSILVVGGFIYLTYLIVEVDPKLQSHLPYMQDYIKNPNTLFSWWNREGRDGSANASEEEHDQHQNEPILPPPSPIYTIPNSMPHIGDKSDEYARLRKEWDERYPPNFPERSVPVVKKLVASGNVLSSIYNQMKPPPILLTSDTEETNQEHRDWSYDIYDCPDDPPPGYPREYKTIDVLKHWPPTQNLPVGNHCHHHRDSNITDSSCNGDKNAPTMAHLGLCVFDYSRDYEKAMRYRSKEVPFVVRNDPSVAETVERWNDENYRRNLFGNLHHSNSDPSATDKDAENATNDDPLENSTRTVLHRAEQATTNQVLFRHSGKKKKAKPNSYKASYQWKPLETSSKDGPSPPMPPPTKLVSMTYDHWYDLAMEKESNATIDNETGIKYYDTNLNEDKSSYYYYFRLVGCGEKEGCEKNATEYLFDEMPFFQPRGSKKRVKNQNGQYSGLGDISSSDSNTKSLYLVEAEKQRGIHCRFGMPGIIAANHYDASRNAIVVLGGARRYIVSRPNQCPNLGLYPTGHPSARHSRVDWTTALEDYQKLEKYEGPLAQSDDPSWIEYRNSLSRLVNNATSTEVILQAGDVLYLPSYWFHYIISLTTNMQCNTRSGRDGRDDHIMADCGFRTPKNDN